MIYTYLIARVGVNDCYFKVIYFTVHQVLARNSKMKNKEFELN